MQSGLPYYFKENPSYVLMSDQKVVIYSVLLSNVNPLHHMVSKHRPWYLLSGVWGGRQGGRGSYDMRIPLPRRGGMASHRSHQALTCSLLKDLPQNREKRRR